MKKKVLIVDDSVYMRMLIRTALEKEGYEIVGEAPNGESAIEMALELEPDLITLDNVMPDMLGVEVLEVLNAEGVKAQIVVVSAVGQQAVIDKERAMGVTDFIIKPFTPEQLVQAVGNALGVSVS